MKLVDPKNCYKRDKIVLRSVTAAATDVLVLQN